MTTEKRSVALLLSGIAWTSIAALVGGLACSDEAQDPGFQIADPTAGTGSGGSPPMSTGGSPGTPGGPINPGVAGSFTIDPGHGTSGGGGGASGGGLEACATGKAKADITPVNMFITFDRSTSMNMGNKWNQAVQALTAFFADPGTKGLKVALRFFPHDTPAEGCSGVGTNMCSVDACATPLVPLAELTADAAPADAHEGALIAAVNMSAPPVDAPLGTTGGTPISAALSGALKWAVDNQAQRMDERTVVVLVTDGDATSCDTNLQSISALAAQGFMEFNIPTYVIGMEGSTQRSVDAIARAGGTMQAFFSDNASTAQQDLINALNAIRGTVLSCAFPMPMGANTDPKKVNVTFTGTNGVGQTLPQTMNEQSCGTDQGWFYDNPANPRTITLCPSTCNVVQADPAAKLDVVLGCETTVR